MAEVVRPDALKRMMASINGNTIKLDSLELARAKLNWPSRSQLPPESLIKSCASELVTLYHNPPSGFIVDEAPGRYFTLYLRREKNDID